MTQATVLSHLATRFSVQTENLATEALAFILGYSDAARAAVTELTRDLGGQWPGGLTYRSQDIQEDGKRPDLVGTDEGGVRRLVLEAKFWAGLTAAQPCSYLMTLDEPGSMLLFVVPAARIDSVWTELQHRAEADGLGTGAAVVSGNETKSWRLNGPVLALCSWRRLLGSMRMMAGANADARAVADVAQLEALCDRMDSEAFLPLSSEELTSSIGRRIPQFGDLALTVADLVSAQGIGVTKGMRASGGNGWFGRYIVLENHGCLVSFNAKHWATWGESPLWLKVLGPRWSYSPDVRTALEGSGIKFHDDPGQGCFVPLRIAQGAERERVVEELVEQVRRVAAALPKVEATVVAPPVQPAAGEDVG